MASALPWASTRSPLPPQGAVPPLTALTLDKLVEHADGLTSLRGIDIHLCTGLLYRIMKRGTLDYKLACIFRDCGHPDIAEAIAQLNLLDAVPTCAKPRAEPSARNQSAHARPHVACRYNSIPKR